MSLLKQSSPHISRPGTTGSFMQKVIFATVPGVFALFYFFGPGILFNLLIASLSACLAEAFILKLRKRDILFYLKDCSALVTAILLALAIPPLAPWWMTVVGTCFAIIFAKHLYGGLGSNPFNPAMIAYVLLLISYPVEMTSWLPAASDISLAESAQVIFLGNSSIVDAFSGATPLDEFKTQLSLGKVKSEFLSEDVFAGQIAGAGWEWINIAFLLGGIYLLQQKVINWHISFAFLAGIFLSSSILFLSDTDRFGSPLFHLLSGGTMLGAFFIATDPVSAATSNKGRLIYGFGIGVLIVIIRTWGGYPDAVAFAVLLFNLTAPTIDHYTIPRAYGRKTKETKTAQE